MERKPACQIGFQNNFIYFPESCTGLSEVINPRHIRLIVFISTAEINKQALSVFDYAAGGMMMGNSRIYADCHDPAASGHASGCQLVNKLRLEIRLILSDPAGPLPDAGFQRRLGAAAASVASPDSAAVFSAAFVSAAVSSVFLLPQAASENTVTAVNNTVKNFFMVFIIYSLLFIQRLLLVSRVNSLPC